MLKLLIFLAALSFITYKLYTNKNELLLALERFNLILLIPMLVLMCFNWWLESVKWKLATSRVQSLSHAKAIKSVLAGLTVGVFTPNRIGNFIGRVLYLEEGNREKGTLISMYTNLAQLITTIVFGVFALYYLIQTSPRFFKIDLPIFYIQLFSMILAIALIVIYLNPFIVTKSFGFLFRKKKIKDVLSVLPDISKTTRINLLGFSVARYMIFTCQFTILLASMNEDLSVVPIWMGVSLTYLITTIIPSPALGKFGIRESVSIFVFSLIGLSEETILLSSLLLWMINLMIPSLLGGVFLLNEKSKQR